MLIGNDSAFNSWTSFVSFRTGTLCIVIPGQTLSINTAFLQATGIDTISSLAHFGVGAFIIVLTSTDNIMSYGHTVACVIGDGIGGTFTNHCSQRQCIQNGTSLSWCTDMRGGTRIGTSLIDTSQLRGTVSILCTFWFRFDRWWLFRN